MSLWANVKTAAAVVAAVAAVTVSQRAVTLSSPGTNRRSKPARQDR